MKLLDSYSLHNRDSRSGLRFTTTGGGHWAEWDRFLALDETHLVHLGNVCGTCEFFFEVVARLPADRVKLDEVRGALEQGLRAAAPLAEAFRPVLPNGKYDVALLETSARRAGTADCPDYFTTERAQAWFGDEPMPAPKTPYHRGGTHEVGAGQKLFEFFVPLTDPDSLEEERVLHYVERMAAGEVPTVVAISVLDVKTSESFAVDENGNDVEPPFPTHWCLAHYLLDGHHKLAAAARSGAPLTVLAFLAREPSWRRVDELLALLKSGLSRPDRGPR